MDKKYIKPAIAAGVVLFIIILGIITGAEDKFGRLITVSGQIATNMMNASHGDPRTLDEMTTEYIKSNTGSTSEVNQEELPKALRPFKKYGHPPFNMGACAVCHAPKRSKPAAIITRTVSALCYKCHEPASTITKKMRALDCNKCHSPHHADRKKLIRNKVKETVCPVGKFNID